MVRAETWNAHDTVLAETEKLLAEKDRHESPSAYAQSTDLLVTEGYSLRKKTCAIFKEKYAGKTRLRILIHAPRQNESPGGYSHALNFHDAFSFMGIPCALFNSGEDLSATLDSFKPNIFLTTDSTIYVRALPWDTLKKYKSHQDVAVGLVAQPLEWREKMPERIAWAKEAGVDFYYCFHDEAFVASNELYMPILAAGYRVLSLLYGANILEYYPVANVPRDLGYVFLGSINRSKSERYLRYLGKIFRKYPGFIDGPGWSKINTFSLNRARDRYVYARANVGINIHLPYQIADANETNERTFMLAACGVPQVTDAAKILPALYGPETLYIADSPTQYRDFFKKILANPDMARERALRAMRETFEKHTTFHRVDGFIKKLTSEGISSLI